MCCFLLGAEPVRGARPAMPLGWEGGTCKRSLFCLLLVLKTEASSLFRGRLKVI